MGQADFKVGDRVRIAALGGFVEVHEQGVFVGNTGTVVTLFQSGRIGIRTDGADCEHNAVSLTGLGWGFNAGDLEPLGGDAPAERIGVLAWLDSLYATTADGAITNRKWPEAQAAHAAVAELVLRADNAATILSNLIAAGRVDARYGGHVTDLTAALAPFQSRAAK